MGKRVLSRAPATAKINLALVVGGVGDGGKHEVATIYQRLALCDRVAVERSAVLSVDGFAGDTIVRVALESLAARTGAETWWRVRLTKRIPVAAGLGGGSSDAATALRLANETLAQPLAAGALHALAATLGADVPFFLLPWRPVSTKPRTILEPLELPQDYWIVLLLPYGVRKPSTADVYARFDERGGSDGFESRAAELERALGAVRRPRDLAGLQPNDLVSSPLSSDLLALGAFRADVTGAGPAVYGLFHHRRRAEAARRALARRARGLIAVPAWYG